MGRMPDTSSVKRLLFATVPAPEGQQAVARRGRGAPLSTWNRVASDDIRTLHPATSDLSWLNDCQARNSWRDIVSSCSTVG